MSYSLDSSDNDVYPGTKVLINKLNILDDKQLADYEAFITLVKASQVEYDPPSGELDFEYYKRLHYILFSDLYEWAGKIRLINISKKTTNFYKAIDIDKYSNLIFKRLSEQNYLIGLSLKKFKKEIAEYYHDINMLHPFREGNGRVQRLYFTLLIRNAGFDINFSDTDINFLMIATIQAANGVMDYLNEYFNKYITKE